MRSSRTRTLLLVLVALIVIVSLAAPMLGSGAGRADAAGAAGAAGARRVYVALGDSYAAGEGLAPYLPGSSGPSTRCNRSSQAYPSRVAATLGATLLFRACGGATTSRLLSGQFGEGSQVAAVGPKTTHVSVTIGGNDINFIQVAGRCTFRSLASRGVGSPCRDADEVTIATRLRVLRPKLEQVLREIRRRAPRAKVVVTTYPRLFATKPAAVCAVFTPADQVWVNGVIDRLNTEIRAAARSVGVALAEISATFEPDHVLCSTNPFVGDPVQLLASGASFERLSNTLHPTSEGHTALATVISRTFAARSTVR